jgi:hypothetical protein
LRTRIDIPKIFQRVPRGICSSHIPDAKSKIRRH